MHSYKPFQKRLQSLEKDIIEDIVWLLHATQKGETADLRWQHACKLDRKTHMQGESCAQPPREKVSMQGSATA